MKRLKPNPKRKKPAVEQPPKAPVPTEGLATKGEAAKFLNLSIRTIERMVDAGKLASKKLGRSRRIPWSVLRSISGDRTPQTA